MLVEASERALCHLKSDSVLLTGGVANNKRLQEMCSKMAGENSAAFSVPKGYCGDNGVMIAWTGLVMHKNGWKQKIEDTAIDQNFRTDKVKINWAKKGKAQHTTNGQWKGAEAEVIRVEAGVDKRRIRKEYRIQELDDAIRKSRTSREPKLLKKAKEAGVNVPRVLSVDKENYLMRMEFIDGRTLSELIESNKDKNIGRPIGEYVAKLHIANIIHGDLTTSNMLHSDGHIFFIDFGLGFVSPKAEDKATDLLLLKKAFNANHSSISEELWASFLEGYTTKETQATLQTLKKAETRGRYL
jgi:bifunctional N6-L-threonylcarbamoyladenine synthase / protein kinase Bud32